MSRRDTDPEAPFDPDAAATGNGIYGLPHSAEEAAVVLIPVPWEATVSYRPGTADGPAAILAASRQVELFDRETGRPYEGGIALLPIPEKVRFWSDAARKLALPAIEAGGVNTLPEVDELGRHLNEHVQRTAAEWCDQGKLVGVIGGDHSSPFGLIRELAGRHPGLGILHLDAHADLRRGFEGFHWSHASIFWNVLQEIPEVARIVQVGVRDLCAAEDETIRGSAGRIVTFFDPDLHRRLSGGETWNAVARQIVDTLPGEVYLSFDIDGLDPSLCPHTGTPVPGGLSFDQAVSLLRLVFETGRRIVGFDLCEVAPGGADETEWDGNVGARLLYKMIGFARRIPPGPAPGAGLTQVAG